MTDVFSDGADEVLNMLRKMSSAEQSPESDKTASAASKPDSQTDPGKAAVKQISCQLFSFASLSDVTRLAHVASPSYQGANSLYKNEANNSYLLLISSAGQKASDFNRVCNLISEYGRPERSVVSARAYLEEHFEPLIKDNALSALAQI